MSLEQIPMNLSLIADEFSAELDGQIAVAKMIGACAIDLRSVGDRNVSELSKNALDEALNRIRGEGLVVASLASALGKRQVDPRIMVERLLMLHQAALRHGVPNIRIFGRMTADTQSDDTPLTWLAPLHATVDDANVELVVEPEIGTGIADPLSALLLLENSGIRNIKLVWDSANFVKLGYDRPLSDLYERLRPHISHVHVKDYNIAEQRPCPSGEGAGQIPELLKRLERDRYAGWVALEPQLVRHKERYRTPLCALNAAADGLLACWNRRESA